MIRLLIENWWLLLVRGIFAVAFAIFIFLFFPLVPAPLLRELAFAGLVAVFALFAIATGLITIAGAVRGAGKGGAAWLLLVDGIAVTAGGILIAATPELTLTHLIQLIAMTALVAGAVEIAAGVHLLHPGPPDRAAFARAGVGHHLADEWLLISSGVISVAFGASLLFTQAGSSQIVLTWTALYAFSSGLAMGGFALRLRGLRNSVHVMAKHAIVGKATGTGAA